MKMEKDFKGCIKNKILSRSVEREFEIIEEAISRIEKLVPTIKM
jgi:uncharacterized protein with HEPN domain